MMNQRMRDGRSPGHASGLSPSDSGPSQPGSDRQPPSEEGEAVFRRFVDMIGGFGMNRMGAGSPMPGGGHMGDRDPFGPVFGENIRRTTFTSPNGMHTTSVTITSGPIHFATRGGRNRDEFPAYESPIISAPPFPPITQG